MLCASNIFQVFVNFFSDALRKEYSSKGIYVQVLREFAGIKVAVVAPFLHTQIGGATYAPNALILAEYRSDSCIVTLVSCPVWDETGITRQLYVHVYNAMAKCSCYTAVHISLNA